MTGQRRIPWFWIGLALYLAAKVVVLVLDARS